VTRKRDSFCSGSYDVPRGRAVSLGLENPLGGLINEAVESMATIEDSLKLHLVGDGDGPVSEPVPIADVSNRKGALSPFRGEPKTKIPRYAFSRNN
jgi:hypothetical protein